jgi:hypothetical protein
MLISSSVHVPTDGSCWRPRLLPQLLLLLLLCSHLLLC